jgi:hypothetical protein
VKDDNDDYEFISKSKRPIGESKKRSEPEETSPVSGENQEIPTTSTPKKKKIKPSKHKRDKKRSNNSCFNNDNDVHSHSYKHFFSTQSNHSVYDSIDIQHFSTK